jgi:putative hemolysin
MKQSCLLIALIAALLFAGGCGPAASQEAEDVPTSAPTDAVGLPNPASVYCLEQGYKHEIRTGTDGSQSGVCIFPDGSECDEWAFYRGECGPESDGW